MVKNNKSKNLMLVRIVCILFLIVGAGLLISFFIGQNSSENYNLNQISDVYSSYNSGKEVYFLDSYSKPIKVLSIEKQNYSGKIYDVTVKNHIILVKGKESSAMWSGNCFDGIANTTTQGKFMQFKTNLYSNNTDVSSYVLNYSAQEVDSNAPNATLNTPVNNTITTNTSQNLTVNITDVGWGIANATLNIYNSSNSLINQTTTSYVFGTLSATLGTVVNFIDGIYTWFYRIFDWAGNSFTTTNNTLTIDTTSPVVNITYPLNNSWLNYTNLDINYSASDVYLQSCWYSNDSYTINTTIVCGANITGINWIEGEHNITIWANDSVNNINSSNIKFSIDTTKPMINFTTPTPENGSGGTSLLINTSITELNFANITYSWNNINYIFNLTDNLTSYGDNNFTFNISSLGNNNYVVNISQYGLLAGVWYPYNLSIKDKAGNINSTETRWQTGNTPPVLEFKTPTTVTGNYSRTEIIANLSAIDNENNLDKANVYLYNSTRDLINSSTLSNNASSMNIYINFSGLADGLYYLNATANDTQGEKSNTSTYIILLDTINPLINFTSPSESNNSYFNRNYIYVNVSASDLNEKNITFLLYNSTSQVNSTTFTTNERTINWTNLAEEVYYYNVSIYDYAGNKNITETKKITLDRTNPLINFTSPSEDNNTSFNRTWIYVNVSVTEINEKNITFLLYNSTSLINSTTFTTNERTINWTNLAEEHYYYNVSIIDLAGNTNITETRKITLDRTAPDGTLNTPVDNLKSNSPSTNFTANITDNLEIKNATLWIFNTTGFVNSTVVQYAAGTISASVGIVVNLIDGIYTWFYRIFDWAGNSFDTTNRTITIDTVAPSISGINYSPNSEGLLDPNTLLVFNASLNDTWAGVDSVILQFYNGTWKNYSMINNSGNSLNANYNVSVVLDAIDNNYTFNIWYNDSAGNSNKSINQTFFARWDCTWSVSPTNLGTIGGFYQEKALGNITISNTGDSAYSNNNCSIVFARTASGSGWRALTGLNFTENYRDDSNEFSDASDGGLRYYFNSSQVISLTVNTSETKILEIYGMFPKSALVLTENPYFPIFSSINNTETGANNATISAKMIITPGAYLDTNFEPSTQTVYLTPGSFNIAAYTRDLVDAADNIQNNTAYNVILNVSLPSTLSSLKTSGDLNKSYEILNNTNKNYTNLTFTLTSSNILTLSPNSYTLYSYTYGYENSTGNLSLIVHANNQTTINNSGTITLACYQTKDTYCVEACINTTSGLVLDPDCSITTTSSPTTGGSGGGSGSGIAGSKIIKSEATFELVRGANQEFNFSYENKYLATLKLLNLSISGLNSEYLKISPSFISTLSPKSSKNITLKISAPAYFTGKKYNLILTISGFLDSNSTPTPFLEKKYLTLYIMEISRLEAENNLNSTLAILKEMNDSGMVLTEILELYEKMKKSYDDISFGELKNLYGKISTINKNAFEAKSIIEQLSISIAEKEKEGINVLETKKILYIAENAFKRGDYALALEKLKEARLMFAVETKNEFNLLMTIKNKPLQSSGVLIGLSLIGFGSSLFIRFRIYTRKLQLLKEEEILLLELMKAIQREYFEKNKMSMEEYEEAINQYEKKLSETIEDKIKIETKLTNLLKLKGKWNALDQEKKKLLVLIKKVQSEYLIEGKIETRVYENMLKTYSTRLSEIEEEIAFFEAQEALKKESKLKKIFKIK